jgi:hypothetical protein
MRKKLATDAGELKKKPPVSMNFFFFFFFEREVILEIFGEVVLL